MNDSKKPKTFGKKEGLQLFIFVGICGLIILIMSLTNIGTKAERSDSNLGVSQVNEDFTDSNEELNINEKTMDNAIQVNEDKVVNNTVDTKEDSSERDIKTNQTSNNVNKDNNNQVNNSTAKDTDLPEMKESSEEEEKKNSSNFAETEDETLETSSNTNISFSKPVEGNLIREFSNEMVYSTTLDSWRTREGIDFKANEGTPIYSVLDGVVEKIDNDLTERGEYIVIKHENGFKTMYTNLDKDVKVVSGQKVRKGEIIASVGNTSGNYSDEEYGAHLNFVMYLNGEEVDPSQYIEFK